VCPANLNLLFSYYRLQDSEERKTGHWSGIQEIIDVNSLLDLCVWVASGCFGCWTLVPQGLTTGPLWITVVTRLSPDQEMCQRGWSRYCLDSCPNRVQMSQCM